MPDFGSIAEILDFAIAREDESYVFYRDLAARSRLASMRDLFGEFAREEKRHKAKILKIKKGEQLAAAPGEVMDLKLSDYLVDIQPTPDMDYQAALIVAMKKERAAFKLYTDLAARVPDAALRKTFLALAQEEAKHKLRFEILYDEDILKEN